MSLASADLPSDLDALRAFVLACQAELKAAEISVQLRTLEIEKLKFQIARLRRMQFGRSSERITRQIEQLELQLEELETGEAEDITKAEAEDRPAPVRERAKPKRKPLPDHLPRREIVHEPDGDRASTCPDCGAGMARLGEDVTEVLDYVPGHFQVIRHVRPKYACEACDTITQAPGPALPTPRGRATPATLAHLLVSKYCDHLPLYRQSEIYAREGVELDRSIGYAGFEALYERPLTDPRRLANAGITEVACWAHCRRKFFDVWDGKKSPVAKEAIDRIAAFYAIEAKARFAPPAERIAHRAETVPLLASFFDWAEKVATLLSAKSEPAEAFRYTIKRRDALSRFLADARLEIDNNIAENAMRGIALGRKNYLLAGSDAGGDRAASVYTIVQTAKLNDVNPEAYLRETLAKIADGHPINRVDALMPWHAR